MCRSNSFLKVQQACHSVESFLTKKPIVLLISHVFQSFCPAHVCHFSTFCKIRLEAMTKIERPLAQSALVTSCCCDLSQTSALKTKRNATGQRWYLAQCKAQARYQRLQKHKSEGDGSTHLSPLDAVVVSVGVVGVQVCRSVHHGHKVPHSCHGRSKVSCMLFSVACQALQGSWPEGHYASSTPAGSQHGSCCQAGLVLQKHWVSQALIQKRKGIPCRVGSHKCRLLQT